MEIFQENLFQKVFEVEGFSGHSLLNVKSFSGHSLLSVKKFFRTLLVECQKFFKTLLVECQKFFRTLLVECQKVFKTLLVECQKVFEVVFMEMFQLNLFQKGFLFFHGSFSAEVFQNTFGFYMEISNRIPSEKFFAWKVVQCFAILL